MSTNPYWSYCSNRLKSEVTPHQFNTWVLPLQVREDINSIDIYAPNRFVYDWVKNNYLNLISTLLAEYTGKSISILLHIGKPSHKIIDNVSSSISNLDIIFTENQTNSQTNSVESHLSNLRTDLSFDNFIEGKSNQLARAASYQIAENPANLYNPLFIYGGVGLGKTHLMHAIGNHILSRFPSNKVAYIYANTFIAEMVKSLQNNRIDEFKFKYRSVNTLLIDDVQFFAGKERSQEEFFHTFNILFESKQQIVLTSDRYPKDLNIEERLKSRFGWGLIVRLEPPDLETRVAIIKKKAQELFNLDFPDDAAFFVGKRFKSNIRDLEGALRRVVASINFTGKSISVDTCRDALKDMLAAQDKQITIDNIQKTVAEYFNIRISDLISANRSRNIARPRQISMMLAKELTNQSLPEIGKAFGGKDHTTVLYSIRKISELKEQDSLLEEDLQNLLRILSN